MDTVELATDTTQVQIFVPGALTAVKTLSEALKMSFSGRNPWLLCATTAMGVSVGAIALARRAEKKKESPKDVGILAMEFYTPKTYAKQSDLEVHNNVSKGKYTLGLGQEGLAVTGDVEDINSICLTVVQNLLEKYKIDPKEIGRLEVGTETLIDKSKSTKTVLMDLFPGNNNMEGATVVNACYGGTSALLNAFYWTESESWDGRYALVVAADIAAYAPGPARPTGGCGAVAVLVGRDAPLAWNPRSRVTYATNVYDFYKPNPTTEYPVVRGGLSQTCYYQALEYCFSQQQLKMENRTTESSNYWVFHAPYNKLVQKSYARLVYLDARRGYQQTEKTTDDTIPTEYMTKPLEETYSDRALDGILKKVAAADFKQRTSDANRLSQQIGNTYTASVFMGLVSLVSNCQTLGNGQTMSVFSYGSGALATLYDLAIRETTQPRFTLAKMRQVLNVQARLAERECVGAHEVDLALDTRARMHASCRNYSPVYPPERLFPGTYYLVNVDNEYCRTYRRLPTGFVSPTTTGASLAPPIVLRLAAQTEVTVAEEKKEDDQTIPGPVVCCITGTAAGLPGAPEVFRSDNLQRLVDGDQCITAVSDACKTEMLEKNVVQIKKHKGGITRLPVKSEKQVIQLSARLGSFDLSEAYGVAPGLAQTMDVAAQVAVAAGLEALKNAGLVSGRSNDAGEWKLPEELRDSTGVVYASSFPAMDAAVGEVMRFLQSKTVAAADSYRLVGALKERLDLSEEDQATLDRIASRADRENGDSCIYEFDRKFLFRVLVLGNAQLAQLAGCRGPNTQTNAACAGTTQAIAMAQDMLVSGRAKRVVVVAGDNASGDTLMPWLGSGFRALGAATTVAAVEDAALPFDKRRSGMIIGAGGIGMVLETEMSMIERQISNSSVSCQARLLATQYSNSAFHGAALDRKHIGTELVRFLETLESSFGITKEELCVHGVYFSHETCTHASDASSCSGNEVAALRFAFGDENLRNLLILNTKGFTGHPMGVSFEDVAAVQVLLKQTVPAVPNYEVPDEYLGPGLKISKGGAYACRYALRFAAGFGSQVAFALYATA